MMLPGTSRRGPGAGADGCCWWCLFLRTLAGAETEPDFESDPEPKSEEEEEVMAAGAEAYFICRERRSVLLKLLLLVKSMRLTSSGS